MDEKVFDQEGIKSTLYLLEELGPLMRGGKRQRDTEQLTRLVGEWDDPVESVSEEQIVYMVRLLVKGAKKCLTNPGCNFLHPPSNLRAVARLDDRRPQIRPCG